MDKKKKIKNQILRIMLTVNSHHTGAYAAQAAYFFVLSLIPILLLLVYMAVRYTPLNQNDVLNAVLQVFPASVSGLMRSIFYQVYNQSETVIPVTIIVALWAAGRGVLSVTSGLNLLLSPHPVDDLYAAVPDRDHPVACYLRFRKQHQCDRV